MFFEYKEDMIYVQVLLLRILSFTDHFADFIIADITAGLKNCMFAEIVPRTFYPLYGISLTAVLDKDMPNRQVIKHK